MSNGIIQSVVDFLVVFATDQLMPLMLIAFAGGLFLRVVLYFTIKREEWFTKEFTKRVHDHLDGEEIASKSFYRSSKNLMEKTYYEAFEVRNMKLRRKPDIIMSFSDRVFLIQHGCARLVRDTLKQLKYLKYNNQHPKFQEISKTVFQGNTAFSRVFGVVSTTLVNDLLAVLPGIFIIGGIFGTFLGIMKALPELGGVDYSNVEAAQSIMDAFLLKISFSMSTSILGIILSVLMGVINTIFAVDKIYISSVERFENTLDMIWNHSENNNIIETESTGVNQLAAASVDRELGLIVDEFDVIEDKAS